MTENSLLAARQLPVGRYPYGASGGASTEEVYRPRDSRLKCIKVSAAQFGERFEREVKVIGASEPSQHLYRHDVGQNYLVMDTSRMRPGL